MYRYPLKVLYFVPLSTIVRTLSILQLVTVLLSMVILQNIQNSPTVGLWQAYSCTGYPVQCGPVLGQSIAQHRDGLVCGRSTGADQLMVGHGVMKKHLHTLPYFVYRIVPR